MTFRIFDVALVEAIHDRVLNPAELAGSAQDESLSGALARVEWQLHYGMISDVFDLAAAYCEAVSQEHCFNDGNTRTAFRVMDLCLRLNGIVPDWSTEEVAQKVIAMALGHLAAEDLAAWLRAQAA